MKKVITLLLLSVALAGAQTQPLRPPGTTTPAGAGSPQIAATNLQTRLNAPTDSDLYCSGFITPTDLSDSTYVVGGTNSPQQTRFQGHDTIFLHGPTVPTGSKLLLLRHVADPLKVDRYPGQQALVNHLGQVYSEMGVVTVTGKMGQVMTATFDLSCDPATLADIAIPLPERPRPLYRASAPSREPLGEPNGKLTGRIALGSEFDTVFATGQKVYLNVGGEQLKPGDYLRVTRTYESMLHDPIDSLEFKNNTDELSRKQNSSDLRQAVLGYGDKLPAFDAKQQVGGFPRKTVGEMMVLYTTPDSATAIVTSALEPINVGDDFELEEAIAAAPTPGPAPVADMHPPTIACQVAPSSVQTGQTATVNCQAASPDNQAVSLTFQPSRGRLQPRGNSALLSTQGLDPGQVSVRITATDARNLSASTFANLMVEAPPPAPQATQAAALNFRKNSAYVDNRAKAALDDIALRLQENPSSTAVVIGSNAAGEQERLASLRSRNAGDYLTKEKGVTAERIQSRTGTSGSSTATVWIVPAGATMPEENNPPKQ